MAPENTRGKLALKVVGWLLFLPAFALKVVLGIARSQGEFVNPSAAFDFMLVLGVICLVLGYGILGRLSRKIDTKTGAPIE